jgi:ferric-dicitrate binding protein FerR (iron transport regulator)
VIDAMGLADPALAEQRVTGVFERIHREQMAGLPLLNNALTVATIGFQSFRSRVSMSARG